MAGAVTSRSNYVQVTTEFESLNESLIAVSSDLILEMDSRDESWKFSSIIVLLSQMVSVEYSLEYDRWISRVRHRGKFKASVRFLA